MFVFFLTASTLTVMACVQAALTPEDPSKGGVSRAATSGYIAASFFLSTMGFACILAQKRWGLLTSMDWEALLLINMMVFGVGSVFFNRRTSAQLVGDDPVQVFQVPDYVTIANPPLLCCVSMALVGSFAGVRFHRLLFLPLVYCAAMIAEYGRAGWLARGWSTCLLVCAICLCTLRTSWLSEQDRRSAWSTEELAKEQGQVLESQQKEIKEKDQEISEHQDQLSDLPGIVPAPPAIPTRQQGPAARQGPRRAQGGVRRRRAVNADGALDGRWAVHEPPPRLATWLRRLHIAGSRIIDGDNRAGWLDQGEGGRAIFESGELMLDNDMLIRHGRTSRLRYVRMQPEDEEDEEEWDDDDDDDDDDRESMADFGALAVEIAAANGGAEQPERVANDLHEEEV